MAFTDGDGPAGKGLLTFRWALGVMSGLTLALLSFLGKSILDSEYKMQAAQSSMASSMATLAQKMTDTSVQVTSNTVRIDDHEHRITILEVRAGAVH